MQSSIIVVGVDYELDGDRAFDTALRIAGANPASEVHVVHADRTLPREHPSDEEAASVNHRVTRSETALDRLEHYVEERLAAMLRAHPGLGFQRIVTHYRLGAAAQHIVQLAVDVDADLIVVGTHNRRGVKHLLLGSVAESVVHLARCPVYVVREKDHLGVGDVPEIEPPCRDCVATRARTGEMWCERHEALRSRPRVHPVSRGVATVESTPWSQTTPRV
jgi:nucleotide-binding universal stress UspA family protein